MHQFLLFAQTYEEYMRRGQFYEILGWVLGALAFVVLIGGVVYSEVRRKRQRKSERESQG